MPSCTRPSHSSVDTSGLKCIVFADAFTRVQCRSRSGATPSNTRAPSNTEEPSQIACVRTPQSGTLPSCHCPSKKVQVCDQSAISAILHGMVSCAHAGRMLSSGLIFDLCGGHVHF